VRLPLVMPAVGSRRSQRPICCGDQSSSSLAATTPTSFAFAASLQTFGRVGSQFPVSIAATVAVDLSRYRRRQSIDAPGDRASPENRSSPGKVVSESAPRVGVGMGGRGQRQRPNNRQTHGAQHDSCACANLAHGCDYSLVERVAGQGLNPWPGSVVVADTAKFPQVVLGIFNRSFRNLCVCPCGLGSQRRHRCA
jgi:hypothetical protein